MIPWKHQLQNNNSFLGFTDSKTALQAGKIEKCLQKVFRYDGIIMERRDAMLYYLRNDHQPAVVEENNNGKKKNSYRLVDNNKCFLEITKTEYDFCLYLIENDLVSEEAVNAYLNGETESEEAAQAEAEEAARKEKEAKEKEVAEKEAFDIWLNSAAEMYTGTTKGNLMESVFIDKYGEFPYPVRAFEILACIDNLDSNERCREVLKSRLHTDNKGCRKTFELVTGLKLPKGVKATMAFLDELKQSDYTEMQEFKARSKTETEKAEVAEDEDNLKIFYILEFDPEDEARKPEYHKILAEPVTKKGFDCFIHEMPDGNFGISSVECGMRLASGSTKREALKELKRTINKIGDVKLRKSIKEAVARFGLSPAAQRVA